MKKIIPIIFIEAILLLSGCNNTLPDEDGYVPISDILTWINELDINKIEKVAKKIRASGGDVRPGLLNTNNYSNDKNDILSVCKMFNTRVKKQFISYCYGCSNNFSYSYFVDGVEYEIGVNQYSQGYFMNVYDEKAKQNFDYVYDQSIQFPYIVNYETTFSIENYGAEFEIYEIDNKNVYKKISYLSEIEFIEATDEEMPNNEAVYFLDGLSKDLLIYSPKIIKYGDTFYKIVSNKDFSDLFN
ncbi:MAG TPA: hypothetical protein DDW20_00480 [Firmicutes bacterium]|nr:hypothetical protein [Bacillota bacterium]